jgi:hypothetical protein
MKKLYTKEELIKKFQGSYINIYPHHYEVRDKNYKFITVYEVLGKSKTLKENFNLPENCF